jgi:hypothetical protein
MNETAATKQVLKKLSALRATLTDEEQAVLDSMIISGEDDVAAHSMRVTERVYKDEDDANAHAMRVTERVYKDEDDAMAHALPEGAKLQPRIVFNPETEVYYIE